MKYCLNCGSELSDYASACDKCGTPVSDATQPTYSYDTPAKKNKKGLLFGLIGGGVGIIVLIVILCLVFCGNVEFGMKFEDTQSAMESNGFFCLGHYIGTSYTFSDFEGEIDELNGRAAVQLSFNEKDELDYVYIGPTNCDVKAARTFMEDELDLTFDEYTASDYYYDDDYDDREYVDVSKLIARNSEYIVIISEYCPGSKKDGKTVSISIYNLEYLHESDLENAEDRIQEIKDGDDEYSY